MKNNKWSSAATGGLILSLVTIVVIVIQTVLEPGKLINILLWIAKLAGSIALLHYFIKDYSKGFSSFSYKEGLSYGFLVCLLSSFICAAYMFLHYLVIFPESTEAVLEAVATATQSSPEGGDLIAKLEKYLPHYVFIFSFIYYTLFGLLVSAIIANYTKKEELFIAE